MKDYTTILQVPQDVCRLMDCAESCATVYVAHVQATSWPEAIKAGKAQVRSAWAEDSKEFTHLTVADRKDIRNARYDMLCGFEGKHDPQFGFQWGEQ